MIRNYFSKLFTPHKPLPAGLYHYQAPKNDPRNYRLHLRLESDGSGTLIINASTNLHLNQTAAEYAYYFVQNMPVEQVGLKMAARYHIDPSQARQDYLDLTDRILTIIETPDLAPDTFLDFERQVPYSGNISAPYRLDCALTYHLVQETPGLAPTERVVQELSTNEWQAVLDKAWAVGIPQITFTGGEPTLRADLPALITHAESNGQISGLLSDGLKLEDAEYLDDLLQTGLDFLMMVLQPDNEQAWRALQNAMAADLYVIVHLTITDANAASITDTLKRLATMGVRAISLSAADPSLADALRAARQSVANLALELVWNLPVPYSSLHPLALELENHEIPQGAGRAWLYVEPDGDVLPGQGINQPLGNILRDPWEKIWLKK